VISPTFEVIIIRLFQKSKQNISEALRLASWSGELFASTMLVIVAQTISCGARDDKQAEKME